MALSKQAKQAIYKEQKNRFQRGLPRLTTWKAHCFLKRLRIPTNTKDVGSYMRRAYKPRLDSRGNKITVGKGFEWEWRLIEKFESTLQFTTFIAETAKKFD